MKKRLLPIALLAALGLVACGPTADPTTSTPETTTTPEVTDPSTTTPDEGPVVTSVTITNKADLQKEWHVNDLNDESRTVSIETAPKINLTAALKNGDLTVKSSDDTIIKASGKVLLPVKAGNVTITVSYKDSVSDTVEITLLEEVITPVIGLKALREGIADSTYKKDSVVDFYGQIYATAQQIDGQIHNGIWVGDGDYSMMLYAGNTSEAWFAEGLKIGDNVYAKGKLAPYNGLNEVKPTELRKMTAEDKYEVAAPTTLTVNADNFSAEGLANQDTRRFVAKDLIYVDGSIADVNSRATLNFKWVKDGKDIKVPLSINYHIGPEAMGDLKAITDTLAPGNLVDLEGVISWFNAPQLELQFLGDKTPAQCIKVAPQPDVESISINGPTSVKATRFIDLTIAALPAGASPAVTWKVDKTDIATINENGRLTGVKEGTVVVTATSKSNDTITATYTVTVKKAPVSNGPTVAETFVNGGVYKFGITLKTSGESGFVTSTITDHKLVPAASYEEAANIKVEAVEGGYKLTLDNKVMGIERESKGADKPNQYYNNICFDKADSELIKNTWLYDTTLNTFHVEFKDTKFDDIYLGSRDTETSYKIGTMPEEYTNKNNIARLYDYVCNTEVEDFAEGEYVLAMNQGKLHETYYFTGVMDGNYLATSKLNNEAAKVTVAKVEGGYTIKTGDKYIAFTTYKRGTEVKAGVELATEPFVFDHNAEKNTFTKTMKLGKETSLKDKVICLGTGSWGTYTTMGAVELNSAFITQLHSVPAKAPTALGVVVTGENTVPVGHNVILNATVTPSGAIPTVTWETSDATKATVNEKGVVTGVAEGKVTITAKSTVDNKVTGTIEITVTPATDKVVGSISFESDAKRVSVSGEQQVWKNEGMTVTNNQSASTSAVVDAVNPVKFYSSSELVIESTTAFFRIDFVFENGKAMPDGQELPAGATYVKVDATHGYIELTEAVTTFTITKLGAQIRVFSMTLRAAI